MKTAELRIWFIIVIVCIIYWNAVNLVQQEDYHEIQMEALQERNALDSLYMEHLKQCSMIQRDDVKVDKNGYFYSAYFKKYK